MYELYRNDFKVESRIQLNKFVSEIVSIAREYINYLIYKNKIYLPDELTSYDAAIDLVAELFSIKNDKLITFSYHFKNLKPKPRTKAEFERALKSYICSIVQNNLLGLYKICDPVTFKILRNIKKAIREREYYVTSYFTDKYIHRKPVDFKKGECIHRELLLTLYLKNDGSIDVNVTKIIDALFGIIEIQKEYLPAIALQDLVYILKELITIKTEDYIKNFKSEEPKVFYKLLIQKLRKEFIFKIKKYLDKKNFSENDCKCVYNIIEEVLNHYENFTCRPSVRELVETHYRGKNKNSFSNKIEYVLSLLSTEILKNIEEGNSYYAEAFKLQTESEENE